MLTISCKEWHYGNAVWFRILFKRSAAGTNSSSASVNLYKDATANIW